MARTFDRIADSYDRWYDSPKGRSVFTAELACLRHLCAQCRGRWLEVGVGTGRFASRLGIGEGIDPSSRMLAVAASRGIRTYEGHAEALPFRDESFDGVLLALTLCFVADAEQTMEECRRALRPKGRLVLGFIPADSAWGRACQAKGAEGHPVYAYARFRTASETVALAENTGFTLRDAASTLFWEPGATPEVEPRIEPGVAPGAGFIGLLFTKARPGPPGSHGWD